jgi:hypothetical protein
MWPAGEPRLDLGRFVGGIVVHDDMDIDTSCPVVAAVDHDGGGLLRRDVRILKSYARYCNETRPHLALEKDAPVSRPVQRTGAISSHAILGGLHHHYARV